jgi:hypothetical protein
MKCKYQDKIELYHDDMLSEGEIAVVGAHLENCGHCRAYLNELGAKDEVVTKLRNVKPELIHPVQFREEVLEKISPTQAKALIDLNRIANDILYVLLQPATRYVFISLATAILTLFIYQHYILVEKIDALAIRMESTMSQGENQRSIRDHMDILSKYQDGVPPSTQEIDGLISEYRSLRIRYLALTRSLESRYPEVYEELREIIDENPEVNKKREHKTL